MADIKYIKELIEELDIWIRLFGEDGEVDRVEDRED